jgi:hypothetical protein
VQTLEFSHSTSVAKSEIHPMQIAVLFNFSLHFSMHSLGFKGEKVEQGVIPVHPSSDFSVFP